MWDRPESLGLDPLEDGRIRLGRQLGLEPAEPDCDDAALPVLHGITDDVAVLLVRRAAEDVRRQPDFDAVQLARLLRAVAVAAADLVPVHAAARAFGRGEDPFDVYGAVPRRLLRVV